jgi:hypothetical protein
LIEHIRRQNKLFQALNSKQTTMEKVMMVLVIGALAATEYTVASYGTYRRLKNTGITRCNSNGVGIYLYQLK